MTDDVEFLLEEIRVYLEVREAFRDRLAVTHPQEGRP